MVKVLVDNLIQGQLIVSPGKKKKIPRNKGVNLIPRKILEIPRNSKSHFARVCLYGLPY